MLSQRSASAVAALYRGLFTPINPDYDEPAYRAQALHDFLFERDYPPWMYDAAKGFWEPRKAQEWLMHLHTGRSVPQIEEGKTDNERCSIGREVLLQLAEDAFNIYNSLPYRHKRVLDPLFSRLLESLEFDGYKFQNGRLLASESESLDTVEVAGYLATTYGELGFNHHDVALQSLQRSEEHYHAEHWEDCVSNARKFLELVLQEVAVTHSKRHKGAVLAKNVYDTPRLVRDYLRTEGVLNEKEVQALKEDYGFLSEVGSHPYLASQQQARFLRHHALSLSQFVLETFQGYLAKNPAPAGTK